MAYWGIVIADEQVTDAQIAALSEDEFMALGRAVRGLARYRCQERAWRGVLAMFQKPKPKRRGRPALAKSPDSVG